MWKATKPIFWWGVREREREREAPLLIKQNFYKTNVSTVAIVPASFCNGKKIVVIIDGQRISNKINVIGKSKSMKEDERRGAEIIMHP